VTALLSWQVPFLSFPGAFDREELEKAAKEYLVRTMSEVEPSPRVPLDAVVAEGEPTESLTIASRDADLLVLGTRGRTRFAGLMLGAVSQGVAATAACPVVLIKKDDGQA
jgi:nucleotide-binding universal stress UspA family protein